MDSREFNRVADSFDAWVKAKNLQSVREYQIRDVVIQEPRGIKSGGLAEVTVLASGRVLRFRVPDRLPLELLP
jgi:hypothetical protein